MPNSYSNKPGFYDDSAADNTTQNSTESNDAKKPTQDNKKASAPAAPNDGSKGFVYSSNLHLFVETN